MRPLPLVFALASAAVLFGAKPTPDVSSAQIAVVTRLYQAFAWESVIDEPLPQTPGLLNQPKQTLLRYFTPRLTSSILNDRVYAAKSQSVGRLDFQPIWDSQDLTATTVKVVPGDSANTVSVRLNRCGRETELIYSLVNTKQGWRISDIQYGAHRASLSTLLQSNP